ncbi:glycoside hydrolase family 47 protein [Boletus reticuloceps]|uniref:alpha-1,2-Mannosidase n=1 Tax=Boletus reticuloceps TaxID=495285 RepID=A0A8I3AA11_9AGAM|nr:glycoside hydrolase family 47 protein [Boletus reticuloceps]
MTLRRWLALASVAALANGELVQVPNLQLPSTAAAHQKAVVDLFNVSYTAYKSVSFREQVVMYSLVNRKYAWSHDDLLPVTKSYSDGLDGWGATVSDALDTMWLMGFHDWFNEAVDYVATVDFSLSKTNSAVSLFETTIRHVGGLLSAYELSGQNQRYSALVKKAEQVAQQMTYAFVGNNAIPYGNVNFADHTPVSGLSSIATAGTLTLEWNRLSLYTGNDTYRQLAEKSVQHVINMPKVLPGMPTELIDPSTGKPSGTYVSWGSGSDSYYEYLIKYPRLTNTNDNSYTDAWLLAVDSSIKVLLKYSTVGNWAYLADYDGHNILHVGSHLACFYGGNWILGGKLTNNDTIYDLGLQLTDACWNTYASTATGIGPEGFAYISSDGSYTGNSPPTPDQLLFYNTHGYYITASDYILRPEVLESNFYAWRATGDTKYLDNAVSVIQSFQQYLPTTVAYTGINDVNNKMSSKSNDMPSFWFGEVLKYLYLTFDDPNNISLDNYVFNTECHPFKTPTAKNIYGSVA